MPMRCPSLISESPTRARPPESLMTLHASSGLYHCTWHPSTLKGPSVSDLYPSRTAFINCRGVHLRVLVDTICCRRQQLVDTIC